LQALVATPRRFSLLSVTYMLDAGINDFSGCLSDKKSIVFAGLKNLGIWLYRPKQLVKCDDWKLLGKFFKNKNCRILFDVSIVCSVILS
jgi:hypothetical protein